MLSPTVNKSSAGDQAIEIRGVGEIRSTKLGCWKVLDGIERELGICCSNSVLRACFGFRYSYFGFALIFGLLRISCFAFRVFLRNFRDDGDWKARPAMDAV